MEPGLKDREYCVCVCARVCVCVAAMEPGLRDREYRPIHVPAGETARQAALEPGLRDREYTREERKSRTDPLSCNGARS